MEGAAIRPKHLAKFPELLFMLDTCGECGYGVVPRDDEARGCRGFAVIGVHTMTERNRRGLMAALAGIRFTPAYS
jgi:hypothetical protein